MSKFILLLFISLAIECFGQSEKKIDSIAFEMCDHLKELSHINDSLKIQMVFEKGLYPFLERFPPDKATSIGQTTYFRFQRNCPEFKEVLNRLQPSKNEASWSRIEPNSEITVSEIKDFKETFHFHYFEVNGAKTNVELKNDFWNDHFNDGTFSKSKFKWISKIKFELTFIKSNNSTRSNYSFKGDKLIYKLLEKKGNYYLLCVSIPGQDSFEVFKLYFK